MIITKTCDVKTPERGTNEAAGLDFFVPNDCFEHGSVTIQPGRSIKIPSGIKMSLNAGKAGVFFNKSSHGSKGIFVGACVVDSDYRGEVHLDIHNNSSEKFVIKNGMKIVQMLVLDVSLEKLVIVENEAYDKLGESQRGTGGFGSTGDK